MSDTTTPAEPISVDWISVTHTFVGGDRMLFEGRSEDGTRYAYTDADETLEYFPHAGAWGKTPTGAVIAPARKIKPEPGVNLGIRAKAVALHCTEIPAAALATWGVRHADDGLIEFPVSGDQLTRTKRGLVL